MHILVENNQKDVALNLEALPSIVHFVLQEEKRAHFDEVSIYFVDEPEICRLHALFFNDPTPTDCISLPIDDDDEPGYRLLGEVFVCPKAAMDYTTLHGGNVHEEVTLYVIHGLLHLLGYDDIESSQEKKMQDTQLKYLTLLKLQNSIL